MPNTERATEEAALGRHCRDDLAHLREWRQDQTSDEYSRTHQHRHRRFALVDITEQAEEHRLAVGQACIENTIPRELFPTVLSTAKAVTAAMSPVALRETRRIMIQVATIRAGVTTFVDLSLVLRHSADGTLTATILA